MCRKNCVVGIGLISLGLGVLAGFCMGSWVFCVCCSRSLLALGFLILKRNR